MDRINVGIIRTGWCGGIRAETCADSPLVAELSIAETNPERLEEVARFTNPKTATDDYRRLIKDKSIDTVIISATPETTHYPMASKEYSSGGGAGASTLRAKAQEGHSGQGYVRKSATPSAAAQSGAFAPWSSTADEAAHTAEPAAQRS